MERVAERDDARDVRIGRGPGAHARAHGLARDEDGLGRQLLPEESDRPAEVVFLPRAVARGSALFLDLAEVHPERENADRGARFRYSAQERVPKIVRAPVCQHESCGRRPPGRWRTPQTLPVPLEGTKRTADSEGPATKSYIFPGRLQGARSVAGISEADGGSGDERSEKTH